MNTAVKERRFMEGSQAVGEAIRAVSPGVIAVFPITPQTHIMEYLGGLVADGRLKSRYILGDSEFSVASIIYGASATGVRGYTATSSQGLLLMNEVLFNMAGTRLSGVLTAVNRSLSPPINIQLDHQDTMSLRDPGIIQLYVENIQEAYNTHIQAFRISEDRRVHLPVMVCMDGFILTHAYEGVTLLQDTDIQDYIPPFEPVFFLNPEEPFTFGSLSDDKKIMEFRYIQDQALVKSAEVITECALEFKERFSMYNGALIEEYYTEDAEIILLALGSMVATIKEAVDTLRREGIQVGIVKVRSFRPFPHQELITAVSKAQVLGVLDRSLSMGVGGILASDLKSFLYHQEKSPPVISYIVGLGGREITPLLIRRLVKDMMYRVERDKMSEKSIFFDLNKDLIPENALGGCE